MRQLPSPNQRMFFVLHEEDSSFEMNSLGRHFSDWAGPNMLKTFFPCQRCFKRFNWGHNTADQSIIDALSCVQAKQDCLPIIYFRLGQSLTLHYSYENIWICKYEPKFWTHLNNSASFRDLQATVKGVYKDAWKVMVAFEKKKSGIRTIVEE